MQKLPERFENNHVSKIFLAQRSVLKNEAKFSTTSTTFSLYVYDNFIIRGDEIQNLTLIKSNSTWLKISKFYISTNYLNKDILNHTETKCALFIYSVLSLVKFKWIFKYVSIQKSSKDAKFGQCLYLWVPICLVSYQPAK